MRLTRSLEERLVNLYRQTKVVGGLFRSLGQEADAVGSAYALEQGDMLSPLIRNLGSMLVKGATPVEILKQYMAKGDSPTRGRELNIHFGDTERGFIGQISPLGDMVPVMAGVTLTFKMRGEDRVGLVYVGDGATSTGAFHEGINFAAVQRCPLVVIIENNGYAYSTPTTQADARAAVRGQGHRLRDSRRAGRRQRRHRDVRGDEARRRSCARGGGTSDRRADDVSPEGTRGARQSVVRARGRDRALGARERSDRSLRRAAHARGRDGRRARRRSTQRVVREIDEATDIAEQSGVPEPLDALDGIYADPPREQPLWFREGKRAAVETNERPEGWGTFDDRKGDRLMAEITYLEAIREALFEEMERDPNVFCLGEDIGAYGGAFKVTDGLLGEVRRVARHRHARSPRSASSARRPVRRTWACVRWCEMQFIDFIANAYDMLTNYVATARYRAFLPVPMVVRGPSGGYVRGGPFHSQNPEAGFIHTPGLKVVYPSTAADAKGLMKAAIRDDDCVLFFEHKYLYRRIKGEMPAGDHVVPIGKARVAREGTDLSIITYAATVYKALEAAEQLEREDGLQRRGASTCDRSRRSTTRRSWRRCKKTNRVLIVHEDTRTGGIAGEMTARINETLLRVAGRAGAPRDGARRARCRTRRRSRISCCRRRRTSCWRRAGWRRTDDARYR